MNATLEDVAQSICQFHELNFVGQVGKGRFKETYHVQRNGLSEALKVFGQDNTSERTSREIEAMVLCNHTNIGKLRYVSEFEYNAINYLFTIEEYLSGGTLTTRLSQNLLSRDELASIGAQLINAIEHISENNLVHRDIKPDNILFKEDGNTPVIVDFGLVRNIADQSLTPIWITQGPGTPYFAAPEQLNNQKSLIDWRTDQFALGVVLSLSFFGIHPYAHPGNNPGDVVVHVAQRDSLSEEFISRSQDANLEIIKRMVAQWPINRFRTPHELLDAWSTSF